MDKHCTHESPRMGMFCKMSLGNFGGFAWYMGDMVSGAHVNSKICYLATCFAHRGMIKMDIFALDN